MTDHASPIIEHEVPPQAVSEDSPHRHATLKKKGSIKRGPSKVSHVGTAGSTTLSPTSAQGEEVRNDVTRSPLYCPVPTGADPTVVLSMRFQGIPGDSEVNDSLEECG
jgi:hypothetical protein